MNKIVVYSSVVFNDNYFSRVFACPWYTLLPVILPAPRKSLDKR